MTSRKEEEDKSKKQQEAETKQQQMDDEEYAEFLQQETERMRLRGFTPRVLLKHNYFSLSLLLLLLKTKYLPCFKVTTSQIN